MEDFRVNSISLHSFTGLSLQKVIHSNFSWVKPHICCVCEANLQFQTFKTQRRIWISSVISENGLYFTSEQEMSGKYWFLLDLTLLARLHMERFRFVKKGSDTIAFAKVSISPQTGLQKLFFIQMRSKIFMKLTVNFASVFFTFAHQSVHM